MTRDPKIICYRHCVLQSIFCKCIPEKCPLCNSIISSYILEPFCLPYPCTNARYQPTTIVVKPSIGNFLDNYNVQNDLHIAIVNSEGIVFEFDERGLVINDYAQWTDCIALKLTEPSWDVHWDNTLQMMSQDTKWSSQNYNSITMNCFTFVVQFLDSLNYPDLKHTNKEIMCEKFILPKIHDIVRYILIYRQLENKDYYVSV